MSGWVIFWHVVIWAALSAYFGLAVVIAIGGFFDVRKMFRRLNEAHVREGKGFPVVNNEQDEAGAD